MKCVCSIHREIIGKVVGDKHWMPRGGDWAGESRVTDVSMVPEVKAMDVIDSRAVVQATNHLGQNSSKTSYPMTICESECVPEHILNMGPQCKDC